MRYIDIDIEAMTRANDRYLLGFSGESNATTFRITATNWRADYPTGAFALIIKRADGECYPCAISEEEGIVTYVVAAVDVSVPGFGGLELQITQDDTIKKSVIIYTEVAKSLGDSGAIPPEDAPWIQQVLDAKTDAEAAADASEAAAASAAASLQDLEDLADEFIGQYLVSVTGETLSMTRLS